MSNFRHQPNVAVRQVLCRDVKFHVYINYTKFDLAVLFDCGNREEWQNHCDLDSDMELYARLLHILRIPQLDFY